VSDLAENPRNPEVFMTDLSLKCFKIIASQSFAPDLAEGDASRISESARGEEGEVGGEEREGK